MRHGGAHAAGWLSSTVESAPAGQTIRDAGLPHQSTVPVLYILKQCYRRKSDMRALTQSDPDDCLIRKRTKDRIDAESFP